MYRLGMTGRSSTWLSTCTTASIVPGSPCHIHTGGYELSSFFSVTDSVVVSIYANECTDATAVLIEEVLLQRLERAGVDKIYATTGGTCLWHKTRPENFNCIQWLSCCRNKAMKPLYDMGMNVFLDDPLSGAIDGEEGKTPDAEDDLVVLFINDVYSHFTAE